MKSMEEKKMNINKIQIHNRKGLVKDKTGGNSIWEKHFAVVEMEHI